MLAVFVISGIFSAALAFDIPNDLDPEDAVGVTVTNTWTTTRTAITVETVTKTEWIDSTVEHRRSSMHQESSPGMLGTWFPPEDDIESGEHVEGDYPDA